jgi:chromosome segregation ATPase
MLRSSPRDRLVAAPPSAMTNQSYSDQLEQEISENRKIRRLLQKARRQSRQYEHQLRDLEDSVKEHENNLQEPWAESHRLLNKLRELTKSKGDTITAMQATISTKDTELADAAESIQALKAELSEAQANAHIKLNELDHVKSIQCTNNQLITENAVLMSRVEELERDLATRDAMVTRYTTRLERLTIKNAELNKSLENSLREIEKGQKSLKDWSSKHNCVICTSAEADRLTGCGHLFCKECLDRWEEVWYRESDPDGDMQWTLKGILTCPTCREWVVMSKVKHIYHS